MAKAGPYKNNMTAKVMRLIHRITDTDEIKTANYMTNYTVSHSAAGTFVTVTFAADMEFETEE